LTDKARSDSSLVVSSLENKQSVNKKCVSAFQMTFFSKKQAMMSEADLRVQQTTV